MIKLGKSDERNQWLIDVLPQSGLLPMNRQPQGTCRFWERTEG